MGHDSRIPGTTYDYRESGIACGIASPRTTAHNVVNDIYHHQLTSSTAALSSSHPRSTAAFIMAYSPDTW